MLFLDNYRHIIIQQCFLSKRYFLLLNLHKFNFSINIITKEEVRAVRALLEELKPEKEYLNEEQTQAVIDHYKKPLETKKQPEEIRSLLNLFIDKVTINTENVVITFKFKVCDANGAVGGI